MGEASWLRPSVAPSWLLHSCDSDPPEERAGTVTLARQSPANRTDTRLERRHESRAGIVSPRSD